MSFEHNPFFWLLVGGLAVWRITSIVQREGIFRWPRKLIGITENDEGPDSWLYPDNFLGAVFACFWCGSVWVAGLVVVILYVFPPALLPFALSAVAIGLQHLLDRHD